MDSRILLADDDTTSRDLLATLLTQAGFGVIVADDGAAALDAVEREHPDVVLTDLRMPGMNGVELCRRLHEKDPDLPVILATGYGDIASAADGMRAGASDYLVKPLDFDAVLATVRRSAERRAKEALRDAQEMFRLTFEHAPIGMALVDLDWRFLRVNRCLSEMVGYAPEALVRRSPRDLVHAEDAATDASVTRALVSETPVRSVPLRYVRSDGVLVDVVLHASLLRSEDGRPRMFVLQIEDATARRRLDAQLALADRLASLGTLTAGIAHEINNPLACVLLNLDLVERALEKLPDLPSAGKAAPLALLRDARQGADRITRIVRGLTTFGRGEPGLAQRMDVHAALEAAATMTANTVRHRARLTKKYGAVPPVVADEQRLVQVFVNLIVNAAQAIPEGDTEGHEVRLSTYTGEGGQCVVEVRDTGSGIPPHLLARVFDPFFSTKEVGSGTGLGLSVSHAIVASFGGELSVSSEPGRGTVFRVTLPPATVSPLAEGTGAATGEAHP